jgi:Domain of unknown function (DUF222)
MDSTSLTFVGHPVVAALGDVSAALDAAAGAEVWSLSDDDLQATIVACEALAARQAAVGLRLVREADARDLGRRLGASSTTAWLRARLRLRPVEAKTRVELANRLRVGEADEGPVDYAANVGTAAGSGAMPTTAAALAEGDVSLEHAGVIARTMADLPGRLSTEQERVAETNLASWAREHDPVTVGRLGRHLIHALDTATLAEREQRTYQRRELRLADAADGSTRISGRLDAESAAMVRAALDPLAAPCPAADGTQDPRTAGATHRRRPGRTSPPRLHHRNPARRARHPPPPGRHRVTGQPDHPAKPHHRRCRRRWRVRRRRWRVRRRLRPGRDRAR